VVSGQFIGFRAGDVATPSVEIPTEWTPARVVAHLREQDSFGMYAAMLERHGIASPDLIDGVVGHYRGQRLTAGKPVLLDVLRHEVKDHFRARVAEKLLDPSLGGQDSYRQMRTMLDGLAVSDRGNLAEVWYRGRHAPDAQAHVAVKVPRTTGENAGKIEDRYIDAVHGSTAIEIKDIEGKIDEEQFGAYLDLLREQEDGAQTQIAKLKYVFTKQEGAIANLERFAEAFKDRRISNRLSVEVFDKSGTRHLATTAAEARSLRIKLKAEL
jgi:hypothetical protein